MLKTSEELVFLIFDKFLVYLEFQKQSFIDALIKIGSENMQDIYRRTPIPNYDFKITLRRGSSPVNLLHINTSGGLLLSFLNFPI